MKSSDQVKTQTDREAHGWYWKCELLKIGGFKNNRIDFLSVLSNKRRLHPEPIGECYNGYGHVDENDWESFYKMWECLKTTKKTREELLEIMKYCKEVYNTSRFHDIKDISKLKNMNEMDKASFGCITKCYYERVGSYKGGVFDVARFIRSLNGTEQSVSQVKECHEEVNSKYHEEERYGCRYFFDLDLCSLSLEFDEF